ncbi:MAG: cupin domain-containing protein [Immundisolibacter sp.]|nr:cupin domain-containing protein [Immundisolibacter sp.]MDD3651853.1 cupin domain-containing protein [Immundisolibacter sp.]
MTFLLSLHHRSIPAAGVSGIFCQDYGMGPNVFADLPTAPLAAERVDALLNRPGLRVERIVSTGQASPPGFWYDQADHEWVLLLEGAARLTLDTPAGLREVRLTAGDWLELPAHCRHRVEATQAEPPTVWLTIFWPAD